MSRSNLNLISKIALTLFLGWFILYKIKLGQLAGAFQNADLRFFYYAIPFLFFFNICKIAKWHLLLGVKHGKLKKVTVSYLIGLTFGLVTPGRIGELVRVIPFNREDRWRVGGLVVVDRILEVLAIMAMTILGALIYWGSIAGGMLGSIILTGLLLLSCRHRMLGLLVRVARKLPSGAKLEGAIQCFGELSQKRLFLSFAMAFICYAFSIYQFHLLLSAFCEISIRVVFLGAPLVVLSNAIPVTVAGLGVREGASALIFSSFDTPETAAVNAAFLLFVMNTFVPSMIGLLLFCRTLCSKFLPFIRSA